MVDKRPPFKKSPKKFHPHGVTILHEDYEILIVDKRAGLLTMGSDKEKIKTAHYILNEYVKKGNSRSKNRIYIVHRLDRDTSGVLVFAKTEKAKNFLQDNWKDFTKTYFAVVEGTPEEKEGTVTSYLAENSIHRMFSVNDPEKGKFSQTGYKLIKSYGEMSLLEINLHTGRKNQIRVHMQDLGHPVVGDNVYGNAPRNSKRLGLHAATLSIIHPYTKEEITIETPLPAYLKSLIKV